jgi:hypothetical protein
MFLGAFAGAFTGVILAPVLIPLVEVAAKPIVTGLFAVLGTVVLFIQQKSNEYRFVNDV